MSNRVKKNSENLLEKRWLFKNEKKKVLEKIKQQLRSFQFKNK